jgi:transposase, IS5 family
MIDRVVPFEIFHAGIETTVLRPARYKGSSACRKPIDLIVMFSMPELQSLHKLSDEQVGYQVIDHMLFKRFLRLGTEHADPG